MYFSASERSERSASIDAVRGVAILLVIAYHWFDLPFGWTGVDLFFVLSGYLIGGILIDNRESPAFFKPFYARRAFRIVPLYLIFLLIMAWASDLRMPLWRYLTFTQNFVWAHTGLTAVGLTGVTWSLAVEEQFYLIIPAMIRAFPTRMMAILSAVMIALAPLSRWLLLTTEGLYAPYVLLPGRLDTLFAGVLIACLVRHPAAWPKIQSRIRTVMLLSAGAFAGFVMLGVTQGFSPLTRPMYLLGYSLITVSYGCGVLAVVALGRRIVRPGILAAIGVGSYSLYLFHELIPRVALNAVFAVGGSLGDTNAIMGLATIAMAIAGSVGLSVACWVLIERPLMRHARTCWRYGRPPAAIAQST